MKVVDKNPSNRGTVTYKTKDDPKVGQFKWWGADSKKARGMQMLATAAYLKENQQGRQRAIGIYARLYGNVNLFNTVGASALKIDQGNSLPVDRPTFNIVQSASDTLVSRISQARPTPVFLTDNSDYKERNLAKKLNNFILGEFYQTKAYEKGAIALRDALVTGTGVLKIFETADHKVGLERRLLTELYVDPNEARDGDPRQLYELKLVDREVLMDMCPEYRSMIATAPQGYPDASGDSSRSVADLVMVVEGWRLPSSPGAKDGRHTIACLSGTLVDEVYTKDKFPFVFLHYSPRLLGFWAQGLAEQLMGTQIEINSLLHTITRAIKLVGVPRVFMEASSKVNAAAFNNEIGTIIKFTGIKPSYEVAPCVPQELYAQLQRLIDYGYQQSGVSALQATSQKPAGLNSGEAIRSYDDISTDRFAALARRYTNFFMDLAYAVIDLAKDICEEQGEYQTVYPGKDGTKSVDLPNADLLKNPFVIQCFDTSSLPREPAGRMQKVSEMITSGMITIKEGRRLLDFPDLSQVEKLANASEERIYQILDAIVEDGDFTPPDPFLDLQLATEITTQYYNLYGSAKLEEEKMEMFRTFFTQTQTLIQAAMPPAPAPGPGGGVPAPGVTPPPAQQGVNSAVAA